MIAAYETGDPYSAWARKAGAMPPDGNKHTHPQVRTLFKRASLGGLYQMGAMSLADWLGVSFLRAQALLDSHRQEFPQFWRWADAVHNAATATRMLGTVFGWNMRCDGEFSRRTIANFPMQA